MKKTSLPSASEGEVKSIKTLKERIQSELLSWSPGMRVLKTGIAIALCLLLEYFRVSAAPYQSSVAAIVCMQPTLKSARNAALDRTLGTLIAGLFAYLFILLFRDSLALDSQSLLYYLCISLCTLPLMMLILRIKKPGALAISLMVFLIIVLKGGDGNPILFTLNRVLDTLIGIVVALFVNWLPLLNRFSHSDVKADALPSADEAIEAEDRA